MNTAQATDTEQFNQLSGTINIAGGTAHIPVMKQAARSIMTSNNNIRITIAGGGSGWVPNKLPADWLI